VTKYVFAIHEILSLIFFHLFELTLQLTEVQKSKGYILKVEILYVTYTKFARCNNPVDTAVMVHALHMMLK
jgi:hypothetical protein